MNLSLLSIIKIISKYFQSNFELSCNGKIIKKGKLILLNDREIFIKFNYIDNKNSKMRVVALPIPFGFRHDEQNKIIYFDYTLKTFAEDHYDTLLNIKKLDYFQQHHMFYDQIVTLKFF